MHAANEASLRPIRESALATLIRLVSTLSPNGPLNSDPVCKKSIMS